MSLFNIQNFIVEFLFQIKKLTNSSLHEHDITMVDEKTHPYVLVLGRVIWIPFFIHHSNKPLGMLNKDALYCLKKPKYGYKNKSSYLQKQFLS